MAKAAIFVMLVCGVIASAAQTMTQDQSSGGRQHHAKKAEDEITVRGCVGRFSTDYILIQPDEGNSYELQGSGKLRLGPYLGQEVELTGVESPSLSNSSDNGFGRLGSASPFTITVHSIKSIAKRCSSY